MHKLLLSYTRLVQKNIVDLVPKAITHRLVDTTLHKLRCHTCHGGTLLPVAARARAMLLTMAKVCLL